LSSEAYCITFDRKTIPADSTVGLEEHPAASPAEPVYLRGRWFDGVEDYARLTNLVHTINLTVELWAKAEKKSENVVSRTLYSINDVSGEGTTSVLVISMRLDGTKFLVQIYENKTAFLSASTSNPSPTKWHNYAFTLSWDVTAQETTLIAYLDGVPSPLDTKEYLLEDRPEYQHVLAADIDANG
jgi:hypothetical protein